MTGFEIGLLGLGGGGLLSGLVGGFQQAKQAKKALQFQKDQYADWQRIRAQNEANMQAGFNQHFNADGSSKGFGFLNPSTLNQQAQNHQLLGYKPQNQSLMFQNQRKNSIYNF